MLFPLRPVTLGLPMVVLLLLPSSARALESAWSDSGKAQARLVVAGAVKDSAPLRAGIEIRLQRGWHTYWRYAGDAGIPPRFDWSGSVNLERAKILWPAPVRIPIEDGLESIGYKDSVLLPVHLYPEDPAKPVSVKLKIDYGVCEKICIPAVAHVTLDIPRGGGRSLPALDAAEKRVPAQSGPGAADKLGVIQARLEGGAKPLIVVDAAVPAAQPFDLFAEGPTDDWALPLPKRKEAGDGRARFGIPVDGAPAGGAPPLRSVRLTLVSGDRAVEVLAPLD